MKIIKTTLAIIAMVFCFLPMWFPGLEMITFSLCIITSIFYFIDKEKLIGYVWVFNASICILNIIFLTN